MQHILIAHDIAQDPGRPLAYNSDHLPLAIDLASGQPYCSAITAQPDCGEPEQPHFIPEEVLLDGQMHWYRIDEPGGYGIGLAKGEDYVDVDMFSLMDVSRPKPAFTSTRAQVDESPPLTRYALPPTS